MASVTRSNRQKKREENKKDVKHLLEEICDSDPDDTLYKIFSRESKGGTQFVTNLSEEDLEGIWWWEDNDDLSTLMKSDVGKIHSLENWIAYLSLKGDFPSEEKKLRHYTITL